MKAPIVCPGCGATIEVVIPVVPANRHLINMSVAMAQITLTLNGLESLTSDNTPADVLEEVHMAREHLETAQSKLEASR